MTTTIAQQVADLMDRREALRQEMVQSHARTDSTWFKDRVNELAFFNRSLARLGAIPADQK